MGHDEGARASTDDSTGNRAWDAVVVGAGIGGLGTAALLTRAGLRVLVLEAAKDIGGRAYSFTHRGHILNVGGPRAGLVGRKVDALFAALALPIPDREEFDGIIHHRDGKWIDLEALFPGWTEEVIWMQRSFHWVESARTPGREGGHRFGVTLPGVEGMYLTGDTVASRALPGLETAADAAVLCARAVTDGAR
jgi:choline dehydrogenase-like flavoprotein